MAESTYLRSEESHKLVAAGALAAGEVRQLADSRSSTVEGLTAVAAGQTCSERSKGILKFAAASGTTFAKGDPVYWDSSANQAIAPSQTLSGVEDHYLGVAHKAKVSGETVVEVDLNAQPYLCSFPVTFAKEFDCEDLQDETATVKNTWTLIPANVNKRGLLILAVYGLVTEVFGGATQDQGIVTVKDSSANTIATLTPTDVGADALNDIIIGTNKGFGAVTGDAVKTVAAGASVLGQVTQETTGAGAAGKMKVYVLAIPLV